MSFRPNRIGQAPYWAALALCHFFLFTKVKNSFWEARNEPKEAIKSQSLKALKPIISKCIIYKIEFSAGMLKRAYFEGDSKFFLLK